MDRAEAEVAARAILASPEKQQERLFEMELKDYFLAGGVDGKMTENTKAARRPVLTRFALDYDVKMPGDITPSVVERWNLKMIANIEDITRNTYLRWLSTLCDWLVIKRRLMRNPVTVKINHNAHSPRKPFCSRAQIAELFEKAKGDAELTFILHCGFNAGLRFDEITQARPHWFDLEHGLIHVQRSATWAPKDKVEPERTIPMRDVFLDFLLKEFSPLPKPFMLAPNKPDKVAGKGWRYRYDFSKKFEALVRGIVPAHLNGREGARITVHTMRHTFASLLVSKGASLHKVASWLGDGIVVTENHYAFLIPKDRDVEIEDRDAAA